MFTAISILILGIILGRCARRFIRPQIISGLILASIFLLLFLLGVSIGANQQLLAALPSLGLQSAAIMLCCVAGSIIFSILIRPLLKPKDPASPKK